jgi:hypothetical protein
MAYPRSRRVGGATSSCRLSHQITPCHKRHTHLLFRISHKSYWYLRYQSRIVTSAHFSYCPFMLRMWLDDFSIHIIHYVTCLASLLGSSCCRGLCFSNRSCIWCHINPQQNRARQVNHICIYIYILYILYITYRYLLLQPLMHLRPHQPQPGRR